MFWGRRNHSHGVSADGIPSGHIDDWPELAVDYVDGHLDDPTQAAIRTHLDACADCRQRLESQEQASRSMRQISLVEAPAELEDQVLSELLFPRAALQAPHRSLSGRLSRDSRAWWTTIRPWVPAAAAVVVILAVVVTVGVVRQGGQESALSTDSATVTAFAGAGAEESASLLSASTTALALGAAPSAEDGIDGETGDYMISGATPRSDGTNGGDMDKMVLGLASADSPAYFSFGAEGEGSITPQQADAITQQVTALTGLGPMDQTFSSGTRAFAAFVPREDAQAVVDLLHSICVSLDLTVSMTRYPGQTVSTWAESLLENKYAVAELDASPSEPPATADWTYTTSTSPATTAGAPTTSAGAPTTTAGAPTTSAPALTTTAGAPTTSAGAPTTTAGAPTTSLVSPPEPVETHVLVVILVGM